ncbi:2-amino-4-hydroxy-6-hydroxymethyldihydropteridine diphosphokinase [Bacillus sp. T3]|uniref:2-amino-4-hydroxy-6- hydroxymethyldihydropteridine diphosphokinase n=1 Tax=Bacillus sp. T3 TaxID=467262 RepID=UPI0029810136|nr:2-amino-4-hydroxy-6-hydroxymethyldihydropteridine diphosphokinase [Bacillus sp. T3]
MAANMAFLALGSNLGDRLDHLKQAILLLENEPEIEVVNSSSIYETDPVGYEEQGPFLNMVVQVSTGLSPAELLKLCLKIENILGRKREIFWGPRTLDLDILLYNQENIETEDLKVPHPRMHQRAFVMIPLLEINKNIHVPKIEKPMTLWVENLPDKEGVRIWKRINGEDVFALFES